MRKATAKGSDMNEVVSNYARNPEKACSEAILSARNKDVTFKAKRRKRERY